MTYPEINALVAQSDAELSAAQAHGMATGMLCIHAQASSATWLTELFLHAKPVADEQKTALVILFEDTQNLLAGDEFNFDLFLPGDEALLSEQVLALTEWCSGFLLGVGFARAESNWPKEATEILKDVVEFTKLDTEAEGEEDECDFVEIVEYLRSAVLVLRACLGDTHDITAI